jgi:hypothetical protein
MSVAIEEETGTTVHSFHHRHNGYWPGTFETASSAELARWFSWGNAQAALNERVQWPGSSRLTYW